MYPVNLVNPVILSNKLLNPTLRNFSAGTSLLFVFDNAD